MCQGDRVKGMRMRNEGHETKERVFLHTSFPLSLPTLFCVTVCCVVPLFCVVTRACSHAVREPSREVVVMMLLSERGRGSFGNRSGAPRRFPKLVGCVEVCVVIRKLVIPDRGTLSVCTVTKIIRLLKNNVLSKACGAREPQ